MGCPVSKQLKALGDECRSRSSTQVADPITPSSASASPVAVLPKAIAMPVNAQLLKARLERLMCVARETPEPVFELTECNLKHVPAGVFILCKVLRKERLDLARNRLRTLSEGGTLGDLLLLTHLDLSGNAFKVLPDELVQLVNLQELHVQHNLLNRLPAHIKQLHRLEFLDCSHNQLVDIRPLACMASLRVLNVDGNRWLDRLPKDLATCDALVDIVCDPQTIRDPPLHILERGTQAVLAYLAGNEAGWCDLPVQQPAVELAVEAAEAATGVVDSTPDASPNVDVDAMGEIAKRLQLEQQRNRDGLLQELVRQQYDNDALVSGLQLKRDEERNKLIDDIASAEASSSLAVDRLLRLRTSMDAATRPDLVAVAEREQDAMLDLLRERHADLQRTKVLDDMSAMLGREHEQMAAYEERRDNEHGQLLQHIVADSERLGRAVGQTDHQRTVAVERIVSDERLQRAAVASLIDRGDGQSWALVEQVRMVEAELVRMTRDELRRRQHNADDQMNQLSAQRMDLTGLLADLLDQQDRRKKQLLDGLQRMESEQQVKQHDFWLLQYQKLLDARPADEAPGALDPRLGWQLLTHGVVHLLPFLSRFLRSTSGGAGGVDLREIDDDQLLAVGVRDATDRVRILRAFEAFSAERDSAAKGADECGSVCARTVEPTRDVDADDVAGPTAPLEEGVAECVVCLERASMIIFLPCGHLCCCVVCQEPLTVCPMCRAQIERRIKVIQA